MAFEERKACLWHAFNALGEQGKGVGVKSQLKVLTQNIGASLGLSNAEAGLEDFRSSSAITFRDYLYYLQVELFNRLQNSSVNRQSVTKINFNKVDEICWMVCSTRYAVREGKKLCDDDTYKLWRLFNFLAEEDDAGDMIYPVVIDKEEVELFVQKFLQIVSGSLDHAVLSAALGEACVLSFQEFLTLVESTVCQVFDSDTVSLAMGGLYEEFIVQVIKKGSLLKKGHVITNWKERWFVMTPSVLRYFTSRDEKDQKGEIYITQYCKAEPLPEKAGTKPNRFALVTEGKTYEISAPDFRTRTEWISAVKATTDQCSKTVTRHRLECRHRAKLRHQRRALLKKEEEKRQVELEQMAKTRLELESEKQARADAEARLQQEAALREAEQQRLREVEELRQQLELLLEAERQAKKDEEIVRSLQSRILEEEFEKREKLEQLKTELEGLLEEERHKREGLEEERLQHEALLTEEQLKLEQLEQERLNMDAKMEEALAKLREAERVKEDLREKMAKKEQERVFNIKVSKLVHPEPFQFVSHRGPGAFPHVILRHVPTGDATDKTSGDTADKTSGDTADNVNTDTDMASGDVSSSSVITDANKTTGGVITTDTDNTSDELSTHVTGDDTTSVTANTDQMTSVTADTDKTSGDESSDTADSDEPSNEITSSVSVDKAVTSNDVSPVDTKETCAALNNNVEEDCDSGTKLPPGTSCV